MKKFIEYINDPFVKSTRKEQLFLKNDYKNEINLRENLIHIILGINTEIDEMIDGIIKNDFVNVKEELGDISWYCALAFDTLNKLPSKIEMDEKKTKEVLSECTLWLDKLKRSLFYKEKFDTGAFIVFVNKVINVVKYISDTMFE
jgi:NTP pyrophosphatase (non-canonical NTP hydrolase)